MDELWSIQGKLDTCNLKRLLALTVPMGIGILHFSVPNPTSRWSHDGIRPDFQQWAVADVCCPMRFLNLRPAVSSDG